MTESSRLDDPRAHAARRDFAPTHDEDLIDESSAASFPASDPPAYLPLHVGEPADPPHPNGHRGH